jgi:hypothetical protein
MSAVGSGELDAIRLNVVVEERHHNHPLLCIGLVSYGRGTDKNNLDDVGRVRTLNGEGLAVMDEAGSSRDGGTRSPEKLWRTEDLDAWVVVASGHQHLAGGKQQRD